MTKEQTEVVHELFADWCELVFDNDEREADESELRLHDKVVKVMGY